MKFLKFFEKAPRFDGPTSESFQPELKSLRRRCNLLPFLIKNYNWNSPEILTKMSYYITEISMHFTCSVSSFLVNLRCGRDGDLALSYSCRFNEGQVVRNTYVGDWGDEERGGGLPLTNNVRFFMTMLIEPDCFRVCPLFMAQFPYSFSNMWPGIICV